MPIRNAEDEIAVQAVSDQEITLRFITNQVPAALEECVGQLLPLLQAQLRSETSRRQLGSAVPLNRYRAILALQMLVEDRLQEAARLLDAIPKLARGELFAADFGFPEFDDEATLEGDD